MRDRGGGLILSPFCRIGSVRLLPIACDMVKLRGRFPHTHLEWRQNNEQIEEHRAHPLRPCAGAFVECSCGAGGGIAESDAFHQPHPCRRSRSPPDGVQHQRQQLRYAARCRQSARLQCLLGQRCQMCTGRIEKAVHRRSAGNVCGGKARGAACADRCCRCKAGHH